ncbi:MAG TPA: fibronectin type III domain-containing protein, partial [Myxococcota bacterium]|nr:fibronectin type III domain-containing protein [Myxococcota bacterium]
MNRSSFLASLTGTAALIAIVASSRDAEGAAVPGTPTPTLQTSTYNSVTVSWPPVAEAQQYTVQLCTIAMCRGDSPKWFKVDPATNTSGGRVVYTVKDLSASARYYVYVQSVVLSPEAAKSPWSVGVDVTTPAAPQVTVRAVLESDDRITCFYYTVPARANSTSLNRYADATAEKPFSGYGMDERATRQCYLLDWKEGDACPSTYYSVSTTVGSGAYRKRYESERVKPDCPCPSAPAAPTNLTLTPTNGVDCRGGIDLMIAMNPQTWDA